MTGAPLVIVGDCFLDRDVEGRVERLCPDAPVPVLDEASTESRPGGAGLAALLAAMDGRPVTLVTALAEDSAGRECQAALRERDIELIDLGSEGSTIEKVRLCSSGRPLLRLDRGGRGAVVGPPSASARAAIAWAETLLVSDYGCRVAAEPGVRAALQEAAQRGNQVIWDPHPRGPAPIAQTAVATPNAAEVQTLAPDAGGSLESQALALARRWRTGAVCVTLGARGALLARPEQAPLTLTTTPTPGDPCGAGDRFATALAGELADGADLVAASSAAVRSATAFVATGGVRNLAASPSAGPWEDADEVIARTRAASGKVVATGGCFDLLHAGHLATLQAARALGGCLIVCLNSDRSVRRLKGPGRPLVPEQDRAAVLAGLRCVDAVVTFDEDTPETVLQRLRPDVWAKGGDYSGRPLPESAVLAGWNGSTVILPQLAGRSTTQLIKEAAYRVS